MVGWRARIGLVGVALLISGCAGSSGAVAPSSSSATTEAAAASESEPTCSDSDDPRLASATLTDAGESLTVQWQSSSGTGAQSTLWAVMLTGADGGIYQLAVKQIGTKTQSWVFDFGTAAQEAVSAPGAMAATPMGVTESFAYSKMPDLGPTFEWKASLSIDGQDVAFCPRSGPNLSFTR